MDTLLKADIFFFITTIAVIAITVMLVITFIRVNRFIKDLRDMTDRVKEEVISAKESLEGLNNDVRTNLKFVSRFMKGIVSTKFLHNVLKPRKKPRKPLKYEEAGEDE